MTTARFISDLQAAADRCGDSETAALLRRAAIRLQNADTLAFDYRIEEAIKACCEDWGVSRKDAIRRIVGDWVEGNVWMPLEDKT